MPDPHWQRRVPKSPAPPMYGAWPTSASGWPSTERASERTPWGLAEDFENTAPDAAETPLDSPITLEDTPIFGDLRARWLAD